MRASILNIRQAANAGGGADAVILNILKKIDRKAFDVATLYIRKYGDDITPIRTNIEALGLPFLESAGLKFFDPFQLFRIIGIIKKRGVRIVHTHDPKSDFFGYLIKRILPKVKLIATLHGWSSMTRKGGFYRGIDFFALKSFDAIVAVSGSTAEYARSKGIARVELIRNSIDLKEWSPLDAAVGGKGFRVGFVGRLSKEKAPLDFLKVAKAVLEKCPDIEFYIAGEGPEKKAVEGFIESSGISRSVRLLGQLSKDEVKRLYA
ncbi:MAG: glycosyltransferase family 4 protein, partial [Deltaproteobacteria bacterium]|nr:glycosyltransferase family 4 protein [Deltaproteobacteria bacterium]